MITERSLVIDYMNANQMSMAKAQHDLRRVGANCTSATEFLEKIGFGIEYVLEAMDFVPCYKSY